MKKIAILQSNYIPWKGYFSLISKVDEFVIYDDVQFTKNDWRNRNHILSKNGLEWITVPVGQSIHRLIDEVSITDSSWQELHLKKIRHNYRISKEETFKIEKNKKEKVNKKKLKATNDWQVVGGAINYNVPIEFGNELI
jgi:hypothetical protein